MNIWKKMAASLLVLLMLLSFAACGSNKADPAGNSESSIDKVGDMQEKVSTPGYF